MDLAVSHAAREFSIRPEKVAALKAHAEFQRDNYSEADIRLAAALMKTAAEISGDTHSDAYRIYCGMLKQASPTDGKRQLASVVYTCLGRVTLAQEKQANPLPKIVGAGRAVGGLLTAYMPDALRMIALGGVGVGGMSGAGLWALNRGVSQEDEKLRQMEIQRDTYHRLNAEVKAELQRRNMEPTPTNTAAAVDYLT